MNPQPPLRLGVEVVVEEGLDSDLVRVLILLDELKKRYPKIYEIAIKAKQEAEA